MDNISEECEVRKGPWTVEEDIILINYIANHGEGIWNTVARSSGLKRTGKSCRLRWLNYLRPDLRRGNITTEEQLLIIELHAKWGNRWSKIAKHLPGRTDNEIKNFWRTRIQKHMNQVENDTNRVISSEIEGLSVHDQANNNTIVASDQPLLLSFGYDGSQSHGIQAYSNGGVDVASSSREIDDAMESLNGSLFSQSNDAVWWEDVWSIQ